MTATTVAAALHGRRSGAGWVACCPAHDDRSPSLSIAAGDGERVLVKCFAGCSQENVIAALKALGLWPEHDADRIGDARIVATYSYSDAMGRPLYEVLRLDPKSFRQRYSDGAGGWTWRKHPTQVLYRLREVLEASIVFVVEGERDVETLRDYGFVASCEAGGANAPWLDSFTETLRGREVILIPDNDPPGRARVVRIARALRGNVARLRILQVDDGAKDISEWFSKGHSECELIDALDGERVGR